MDLITELFELSKRLDDSIKECGKATEKYAKAERDYKVALSQATLQLRAKDYPVTIIPYIVKGLDDVSDLRLKRDIARGNYCTAHKIHDSLKLQLTLLDRQVQREWGSER